MKGRHHYATTVKWTGNTGEGTRDYGAYGRGFVVQRDGKAEIQGSSDPAFRGDPSKYNPEELLLAALSSCHMLMYLHLCALEGVVQGLLRSGPGEYVRGRGRRGKVYPAVLCPWVHISDRDMEKKARDLHKRATAFCYLANSVNFEVFHEPQIHYDPDSRENPVPLGGQMHEKAQFTTNQWQFTTIVSRGWVLWLLLPCNKKESNFFIFI